MAYSVRPAHTHHPIGFLHGSRLSSSAPVAHIYQTRKSPLVYLVRSLPVFFSFSSLLSPTGLHFGTRPSDGHMQ